VTVIHDGMNRDYPLLWEKASEYDFAERLGGCTDPLMAEIDAAMRELFSARSFMADQPVSAPAKERP